MSSDSVPKSAYELAMERLQKKDADEGVERQLVTEEQKAAIAEVRSFYQAKLAELELLHQSKFRMIMDPGTQAEAEQQYRRDRERLTTERDNKIERVRKA